MFEIWYIHITLAIISVIVSILIFAEFYKLRREFNRSRVFSVLLVVSIFLTLDSVSDLFAFSMWSSNRNPIIIYPSLAISVFTTLSIILLYYYITRV
ncbi:hypothetical protein [Acidianus ambivalens]|uniref:Uncharacterized protein n=1 Tax=Acidianus ambivalens TaxID=2283 RepID=A0A650CWW8_ACIAM|nr:hypothetical protein [Acidianus ambivalens]MQL54493.1 hypothetical protein [Acidianus ambivalens]QGR22306.1 hypothetical protein D1866_10230 [Acidianus ambivalens]